MTTTAEEIVLLQAAKTKILNALAAGASIVKEIEIRGRVVKHNDLMAELESIDARIALLTAGPKHLKPARSRVKLGR